MSLRDVANKFDNKSSTRGVWNLNAPIARLLMVSLEKVRSWQWDDKNLNSVTVIAFSSECIKTSKHGKNKCLGVKIRGQAKWVGYGGGAEWLKVSEKKVSKWADFYTLFWTS